MATHKVLKEGWIGTRRFQVGETVTDLTVAQETHLIQSGTIDDLSARAAVPADRPKGASIGLTFACSDTICINTQRFVPGIVYTVDTPTLNTLRSLHAIA
jgi:hypothetical protein